MSTEENYAYVGAIGITIEVILGKPITDVTSAKYKVKKPKSGNIVYWTATIVDIPTGTLQYKTLTNDLDEVGILYIHPMLSYIGGEEIPCKPVKFPVKDEFEE